MRRFGVIMLVVLTSALTGAIPVRARETSGSSAVELLDAGAAPRETIRLLPTAGHRTSQTMLTRTKIVQSGASSLTVGPLDVQAVISTTTGTPADGGTFPLSFRYEKLELLDSSVGSPAQLQAARANYRALAGVTGLYTLTTSGDLVDAKIDVPPDANPLTTQLLKEYSKQTDQLAVPFPDDAVGVGARWRATTEVDFFGIHAKQSYIYTLRDRQGTHLELDLKVVQTAKRGRVHLPGVGNEVDVFLSGYRVRGSGTISLDLEDPIPTTSTMSVGGVQRFIADNGSDTASMTQRLQLKVSVEPAPL